MSLEPERKRWLARAAEKFGSPAYVYFADEMRERCRLLRKLFGKQLRLSYAVKANPNIDILRLLRSEIDTFDISSIAEAHWVRESGADVQLCSFTGPAKRRFELEKAVQWGVGQLVCEGVDEILLLQEVCESESTTADILIRINPSVVPKGFGVQMARKPSQFGVDEEKLDDAVAAVRRCANLNLIGWHIYSGTNSLSVEAVVENFVIMIDRFRTYSRKFDVEPKLLIFGAGFGIPYLPSESDLDVAAVAVDVNALLDELRGDDYFAECEFQLELGRWIVGPCGYLVTKVISVKESRGSEIALCDAGFNNQLSACGMMGAVIRRNWNIFNVSGEGLSRSRRRYRLVGPLCTTIDQLASDIELPQLAKGDMLAIAASGAYGYTASPTRFISHPPPAELLVRGQAIEEIADQWSGFDWDRIVRATT